MTNQDPTLDTCGCCETADPPPILYNRPGLPVLAYRIGTHGSFLQRMMARLSTTALPDGDYAGERPLSALTTRSTDDPAIALLDAWAMTADVLTFYQERIANEGYLRTATERLSVLELARAIGYELNPGVAATAYLAFTIEDAAGSPGIATIPAGAKVQSIPKPGELPQTFETSAVIQAKAAWNSLRPRLSRPQELAIKGGVLYLLGLTTRFPSGTSGLITIQPAQFNQVYPLDSAVFLDPADGDIQAVPVTHLYLDGITTTLKVGDVLLLVGKNGDGAVETAVFPIQRLQIETSHKRIRLDLTTAPTPAPFAPALLPQATFTLAATLFNQTQITKLIQKQTWHESDLKAFLTVHQWSVAKLTNNLAAIPAPPLPTAAEGVFGFRERVSFFGHNAPLFGSLPKGENLRNDPYAATDSDWDAGNGRSIWTDSWGNNYATHYGGLDVFLERAVPEIVGDSWLVLQHPSAAPTAYRIQSANDLSITGYGLSAKATGLNLKRPNDTEPDKSVAFNVRRTTAFLKSERQLLAQLPIEDALQAGDKSLMIGHLVLDLQEGQPLLLSGEQLDAPGVTQNELIILADIVHNGGFTTLHFQDGLKFGYVRQTVTLNANVAKATHGETVPQEVLGSGDGAKANQQFILRKTPLTYVSAPTPSGSQSTLTVRVNGIEWAQQPSLYGLDANDQSYTVRLDDDGKTHLIFGNGRSGSRLPTGRENIIATYRTGIGLAGEVAAGSLTLLQSRPLGVREVTNPLPASGAEAPETLDTARSNAPLTILTMERIVSLQDFEDFARSFAGVGKAKVVVLWNGENSLVHITIASSSGQPVDATSDLYTNLVLAVDSVRDPTQQVRVDTFQPLFFNVAVKVLVDKRYVETAVFSQISTALQNTFAFNKRTFGQPVTSAEIVQTIHQIPGVVAADLDKLYLVNDPIGPTQPIPPAILPAALAHWAGNTLQLAQLLLISPAGVVVGRMEGE